MHCSSSFLPSTNRERERERERGEWSACMKERRNEERGIMCSAILLLLLLLLLLFSPKKSITTSNHILAKDPPYNEGLGSHTHTHTSSKTSRVCATRRWCCLHTSFLSYAPFPPPSTSIHTHLPTHSPQCRHHPILHHHDGMVSHLA
jgi:hypothetical protein